MKRRFNGGILALSLLAVMGAASAGWQDGIYDYLDLEETLTWNGAVLDAPNTGTANNRTFFRGDGSWASTGLQDAAHDILTADTSTMSSTYVTLLSGEVDVGEAGDAVRVDVTAQLGWMGAALFVVDDGGREIWQLESPANPALATNQGSFPSGLGEPTGVAFHEGAIYVVDNLLPQEEMWRCADPTSPGLCTSQGSFPTSLNGPQGIVSHGGAVYVGDSDATPNEMWRCADPTSPGLCTSQGSFPSGIGFLQGMASFDGAVYVVDSLTPDEMWRCADPTDPGACTNQGSFPIGLDRPRG